MDQTQHGAARPAGEVRDLRGVSRHRRAPRPDDPLTVPRAREATHAGPAYAVGVRVAYSPGYFVELEEGHRFPMGKFPALHDQLVREGLVRVCDVSQPAEATREDLLRVHTSEYLDALASATLDRRAKAAEVDASQVKLAQYALVALLDEIVLSSSWPAREEWTSRPLQLKYFNDVTAGEGFYTRLDELRGTKDRGRLDVLEVFATCLGLGFKGKFADPEKMENPRLMVGEISREIREARKQRTDELSGHWLPEDRVTRKVKAVPVWMVAATCFPSGLRA